MSTEKPTFSFGENWLKYLDHLSPIAVKNMSGYVDDWLGDIKGLRIVDVGSGQGLFSLVAHEKGASVVSLDVDPASVRATNSLREGDPADWVALHGSVLDAAFVSQLGTFDVVVSWGVLHHTGDVFRAIDNAAKLVSPGARLWLALYHLTERSRHSLRIKRLYNRMPRVAKASWRGVYAGRKYAGSLRRGNPRPWIAYRDERGMDWLRDQEDWLGGLPYQPVTPEQVLNRLRPLGFQLVRLKSAIGEGGNNIYLFERAA